MATEDKGGREESEPRGKIRVPGLCGARWGGFVDLDSLRVRAKLREWPFGLRDNWLGCRGQSTWPGRAAIASH